MTMTTSKTRIKILFGIALTGFLFGQTSLSCAAAGFCGNDLTEAAVSSGDNNNWLATPFRVTSGSLTANNFQLRVDTVAGAHVVLVLVCDTNTTGAVIAAGGTCPANNVVCSQPSTTPTTGVNTFVVSGCGTLLTAARYWLMFNNDQNSFLTGTTTTGSSVDTWFLGATCCSVPTSITGTVGDTGGKSNMGVNLTASGGSTPAGQFPRMY